MASAGVAGHTHASPLAVCGDNLGAFVMPTRGAESASASSSDSRGGRERGSRRHRRDSSGEDSSSSDSSMRGSRRRRRDASRDRSDRSRDGRAAKKARKQEKKVKKARKREKKEAKREAKRARHRARARDDDRDDDEGGTAGRRLRTSPPRENPGGLELRSREIADASREKCEREEETRRAIGREEDERLARVAASEATTAKRLDDEDEPEISLAAPATAASPAFAGFGAAMTLEQYRAMASQRAYMRGTVHAAPVTAKRRDDEESDPKAAAKRSAQWACTSYKCGKDGAAVMNPKFADRCSACGAMKPLNAGAEVFKRTMTDAQYLANQSRRRGK